MTRALGRERLDHAGRQVVEILDAGLGQIRLERLEQVHDLRHRARVEHEVDADLGACQPGFAKYPVVDRIEVERDPVERGTVLVGSSL